MGTAPKCRQTEGWEQTGREREKMLLAGGVAARLLPFLSIPLATQGWCKQSKQREAAGVEKWKLLQAH